MNIQKLNIPQFIKDGLEEMIATGSYTKNQIVHFISQCHHESAGFARMEESFNYSPNRLLTVFGKRVKTLEAARQLCSMGPIAIANFLYGGRMENSATEGWAFRGRGPLMITGKRNYRLLSKYLGVDLLKNPDLVKNKYAMQSAKWYFDRNKIFEIAKGGTEVVNRITKLINGGLNGLEDRKKLFDYYYNIL